MLIVALAASVYANWGITDPPSDSWHPDYHTIAVGGTGPDPGVAYKLQMRWREEGAAGDGTYFEQEDPASSVVMGQWNVSFGMPDTSSGRWLLGTNRIQLIAPGPGGLSWVDIEITNDPNAP